MTTREMFNNTLVTIGIILVVFIVFGSFVRGCEQTEMTKRERIKLELEQVKAGYSIERSQTMKVGTEGGQ